MYVHNVCLTWILLREYCIVFHVSLCLSSGGEEVVVHTRADTVERWGHDMYIETEQGPREQWEKERVGPALKPYLLHVPWS